MRPQQRRRSRKLAISCSLAVGVAACTLHLAAPEVVRLWGFVPCEMGSSSGVEAELVASQRTSSSSGLMAGGLSAPWAGGAHNRDGSRVHLVPRMAVTTPAVSGALATLALLSFGVKRLFKWLDTPSRPYEASGDANSVRSEYDQWTKEGVLEHYWGEHIHMGSYTDLKEQKGFSRNDRFLVAAVRATLRRFKNFKEAKIDFCAEMLEFSGASNPKRILDVGCGIGGTSRFLAKRFPDAEVVGITLSPEQVRRGTELADAAGLKNVRFEVINALDMSFPDGSFDLVWGCESGEHMPDKAKYIEEMARVCSPGGRVVVATWCQRDPEPPFSEKDKQDLKFVYEEWSHPYFISINDYANIMKGTGVLETVETADWTERTLPSWRHSIWVGVWSPWYWMKVTLQRPKAFLGFLRDAYTLEKFHLGMKSGLLQFGMMKARKQGA
eukprot:TRINITY_DN78538_c0_g1_i1.p1 TRINITY_DN78538_c0_g1~~TRINITY_DN78538_c0_g1_i1.p1  ORF type:complete len:463 (+),score=51.04 TRINITY_DN78538_c0_g1_i1:72-1391(+)